MALTLKSKHFSLYFILLAMKYVYIQKTYCRFKLEDGGDEFTLLYISYLYFKPLAINNLGEILFQ